MGNQDLKSVYNQMHSQGSTAWFDDGALERDLIVAMGESWAGLDVLEIGCGEGDLLARIQNAGADICVGVDYSEEAIRTAQKKHPDLELFANTYRNMAAPYDVVVMQGVLEHLDDPFKELRWMIDRFEPKTVITTSPGFLNPRGIVWMTLNMLGAVMSKTDLHHLHPWDFQRFCSKHRYKLTMDSTDVAWGFDDKMIKDLTKRLPLALKDGNIPHDPDRLHAFLSWLSRASTGMMAASLDGAVICYRIDL